MTVAIIIAVVAVVAIIIGVTVAKKRKSAR